MSIRILQGDCREVLKTLPGASAHCCVTSPPYFGLRDYGTATWEGGDPACNHRVGGQVSDSKAPGAILSGVRPGVDASACKACGAKRIDSQIGLEPSPDEYVGQMVAVFREVRRVLRDDGTLWLNLGDSYVGAANNGGAASKTMVGTQAATGHNLPAKRGAGLKSKDLIGIPWRVAFALQADGWYLRQDIIWSKPNPMPESVLDRCTKSHEYVFLLSKSERYWFNSAAIAEPVESNESDIRKMKEQLPRIGGKHKTLVDPLSMASSATNIGQRRSVGNGETRNKRSVWTIATQPYSEAHFATMAPALAENCIKAGCPEGGVVLDPFGGAGTTGLVADRLQRDALLIELNPEYATLARNRIHGDAPLFADVQT